MLPGAAILALAGCTGRSRPAPSIVITELPAYRLVEYIIKAEPDSRYRVQTSANLRDWRVLAAFPAVEPLVPFRVPTQLDPGYGFIGW